MKGKQKRLQFKYAAHKLRNNRHLLFELAATIYVAQ